MIFEAIPDPFTPGRWLVCRIATGRLRTVVSSHCEEISTRREADRLQRADNAAASVAPARPGQMVLGFYSDEQP